MKLKDLTHNEQGLTLVNALVALGIFSVVSLLVATLIDRMLTAQMSTEARENALNTATLARAILSDPEACRLSLLKEGTLAATALRNGVKIDDLKFKGGQSANLGSGKGGISEMTLVSQQPLTPALLTQGRIVLGLKLSFAQTASLMGGQLKDRVLPLSAQIRGGMVIRCQTAGADNDGGGETDEDDIAVHFDPSNCPGTYYPLDATTESRLKMASEMAGGSRDKIDLTTIFQHMTPGGSSLPVGGLRAVSESRRTALIQKQKPGVVRKPAQSDYLTIDAGTGSAHATIESIDGSKFLVTPTIENGGGFSTLHVGACDTPPVVGGSCAEGVLHRQYGPPRDCGPADY